MENFYEKNNIKTQISHNFLELFACISAYITKTRLFKYIENFTT